VPLVHAAPGGQVLLIHELIGPLLAVSRQPTSHPKYWVYRRPDWREVAGAFSRAPEAYIPIPRVALDG
jgi:hypothetical protein